MGTRSSFPGGKAAGAWSYTSTPPIRLHGMVLVKHRDNFAFTFTFMDVKIETKTFKNPFHWCGNGLALHLDKMNSSAMDFL
jgi:hypothetical protein